MAFASKNFRIETFPCSILRSCADCIFSQLKNRLLFPNLFVFPKSQSDFLVLHFWAPKNNVADSKLKHSKVQVCWPAANFEFSKVFACHFLENAFICRWFLRFWPSSNYRYFIVIICKENHLKTLKSDVFHTLTCQLLMSFYSYASVRFQLWHCLITKL